ncbi:ciliary microtubule inner protein 5 isoform X2 [Halichoeres trimaculatus]|uniref:ciliary microtubule inner protein 5 isoform X2 n=1 Tax=Halichoeres trimaculatus TaxID=147232 RepID=UPI003D9EFA4C
MRMDLNRRVSSAGYRLPERNKSTRPKSSQPTVDRSRHGKVETVSTGETPEKSDTVKQDRAWTELVRGERRGVREWEKNWGFLMNYDQLGQPKPEKPPPSYVPLFSGRVPNTTNQMFGSRLSTPLGSELVKLDRLLIWSVGIRKRKLDPQFLPC